MIENSEDSAVVNDEEKQQLPAGVVVTERQTNLQYFWKGFKEKLKQFGFLLALGGFFLLLWLFFDWWVFVSMVLAFPVVWLLFPYIAKFFMSYVYALNLDIEKQKATLCGIPYNRFEKAAVVNALGKLTTINAPFAGENGFLYSFDRIDFLEDHSPVVTKNPDGTVTTISQICDVFESNPYHTNLHYLGAHKAEFLAQRRELLAALDENGALRFSSHVKARRKYLERVDLVSDLADKYVYDFPVQYAKYEVNYKSETQKADMEKVVSEINELKKQMGMEKLQNELLKNEGPREVVERGDDA